ncbi:MAG: alpha-2-macroglobulin family protein, partial [Rhodobacteraceae bacterium]|nr:alpha-2-macroglobulin family protein [Paracoccaceae bacterium]
MRIPFAILLAFTLASAPAAMAQDQRLIPDRRAILTENVDFYGSDLQQIFDTTLEVCEQTCLTNSQCSAFTFNARSNACFPKRGVSQQEPYQGAISGWIRQANSGASALAKTRAAELGFLSDADFRSALRQAEDMAREHVTGERDADDLLASAAQARAAKSNVAAANLIGAAINLTDRADQWADYAQTLNDVRTEDQSVRRHYVARSLSAAINAYLRADNAGGQATALAVMARALEQSGRGRDMIPALRLAQSLQPRDDAQAMLDDAIGKYGFRIVEHEVQSDAALPRLCAVFSEDLLRGGTDYSPFVKLAEPGLSVDASARQICVSGVEHGRRYTLTFREGLPSASGEKLAKDVTLNLYVRDRTAAVRFPGRAYIMPRIAAAGIPVETVNADTLDLTLMKVSDRNLIRAIQSDYFGRPMDYWSAEGFRADVAEEVWTGSAEVAMEVNRDMLTRLPLDDVMGSLGPGIYALQAGIPGRDPYDNPPATQWFVISDLGMTTLSGADGLHVFVRSFADVAAIDGATVTLLSRANAVIGTLQTDADGHAAFAAGLTAGRGAAAPALVSVAKGDDFTFLSLTEPEFDLSDRGVSGHEPAPPIDVFLATDRGAYRAGETVNATLLARDAKVGAIEGLPLTARLTRPDGVEYVRALLTDEGAGGHVASLPLAGSAPHGTWRIEVFAEENRVLAQQSFLVEDFLPERIDFTLALPETALRLGQSAPLTVEARYLFGAPGADLGMEGDLRLRAAAAVEGFPGYRFGRYDEYFSPYGDGLFGLGTTDAEGKATVPVDLPALGEIANRPLEATIALRLKEGSGRPVERRITRQIMPDVPVIGIEPAFEGDVVPDGDEARFSLIAVASDLTQTPLDVHWTVNRIERSYQWYSLYGQWNWDVTTTRTRVAEGDLSLTADGPATLAVPVAWGNHEIVVETRGGAAYSAAAIDFDAGWYAPASTGDAPDTLDVSLDKPAYRAGDTATIRIVPRAAGVALVTVVSNRLIDMKAVAVTEGENLVDLPVTDDWGAGAYITASVLRPLDTDAGRAPSRALGLSYAPVDPGAKRLTAGFDMAAEADPRAPMPVALKVDGIAPGETAYATIAAVDVGILNLTGYTSPDPEDHYFGQRKLGVGIRDVYGRLIDGQNGAMGKVRSGGDADTGLKMQAPPPTEELVAYFSGPVTVGDDGYARTEFNLPSFNGTVR